MATIVRFNRRVRPSATAFYSPPAPRRRRWRFRPRGLVNLFLLVFVLFNLYLLVDNLVRLVKQRRLEAALDHRLGRQEEINRRLTEYRDWMQSEEYLRTEAAKMGLVAAEEGAATAGLPAPSPLKRAKKQAGPPY